MDGTHANHGALAVPLTTTNALLDKHALYRKSLVDARETLLNCSSTHLLIDTGVVDAHPYTTALHAASSCRCRTRCAGTGKCRSARRHRSCIRSAHMRPRRRSRSAPSW
jgi:hypothetical protein